MKDNRSEKVKAICKKYVHNGCRDVCPLAIPCNTKPGDTKAIFDDRMNDAAIHLEDKKNDGR